MATSNVFKSSTIYGILRNSDNTTASPNINANAIFDRDINVTGKVKTNHIEPTGDTIDISGNNIYLGHAGNNVYIKDVLFTEGVYANNNNTFTGTNTFNAATTIKNSLNFTNGSNPVTAKIIPVDMGGASVMKIQSRGLLYIDANSTDDPDPYLPYFYERAFYYGNPNIAQPYTFESDGALRFSATKLIFNSSGAIDFGTASLTRFSTPLLSDNSLELATTEFVKEQDYVTQTNTDALYITIANPITSIAPTISTSITNKLYVDTNITNTFNSVFTGNQTYSGINTYNTLPRSNVIPTLSNELITKEYADATYSTGGGVGDVTAGGNNAFSGLNTFNTNLPTSTITPTTSTQLVTKNYTDSIFQTIASMSNYLSNATAGSTYATLLSPTLTGTPNAPTAANGTNTNQIATTAYVNNQGYLTSALASSTYQLISSMSSYLTSATAASTYQLISEMSSYATLVSPVLSGTPTTPTANLGTNTLQIANTAFVIANSITAGANNAFTGTNTFNTSLPTSTLTPSSSTQLVTKNYTDSIFQTIANMVNYVTIASTNIITGINFFTNKVYINGLDTSTNLIGFNNASSTAISANVVTR